MTTQLETGSCEPGLSPADAATEAVLRGLNSNAREPAVDPAKEAQFAQMKERWRAAQKKQQGDAALATSRYESGARRRCADGMDGQGVHGVETSDSQGLRSTTRVSTSAACTESHGGEGDETSHSIVEDKDAEDSKRGTFRRPTFEQTEAVDEQKLGVGKGWMGSKSLGSKRTEFERMSQIYRFPSVPDVGSLKIMPSDDDDPYFAGRPSQYARSPTLAIVKKLVESPEGQRSIQKLRELHALRREQGQGQHEATADRVRAWATEAAKNLPRPDGDSA
jgi:hypothetical protein